MQFISSFVYRIFEKILHQDTDFGSFNTDAINSWEFDQHRNPNMNEEMCCYFYAWEISGEFY